MHDTRRCDCLLPASRSLNIWTVVLSRTRAGRFILSGNCTETGHYPHNSTSAVFKVEGMASLSVTYIHISLYKHQTQTMCKNVRRRTLHLCIDA
eukprot:55211-Eustigmatos_ZCMA.PRE.2